jgi:hypothetical protein
MFHRDSFPPSELMVVKRSPASTLRAFGSLVRLASGGPVGVFLALNENDEATITWLTNPATCSTLPNVCLIESNACASPQAGVAQQNT